MGIKTERRWLIRTKIKLGLSELGSCVVEEEKERQHYRGKLKDCTHTQELCIYITANEMRDTSKGLGIKKFRDVPNVPDHQLSGWCVSAVRLLRRKSWYTYLSEGALSEAYFDDSAKGYYNHRGQGYGLAQMIGPVWELIDPTGYQRLVVQEFADEENLKGEAENSVLNTERNQCLDYPTSISDSDLLQLESLQRTAIIT